MEDEWVNQNQQEYEEIWKLEEKVVYEMESWKKEE